MSHASLVRNMQETAVGNRMIKGLINMVATGPSTFDGGDRILNSTPPWKIYRNTKSNNFAGWTFVATTGSHYRRSLTPPFAGAFKEAPFSIIFDFWNLTPEELRHCSVAPWPSPPIVESIRQRLFHTLLISANARPRATVSVSVRFARSSRRVIKTDGTYMHTRGSIT